MRGKAPKILANGLAKSKYLHRLALQAHKTSKRSVSADILYSASLTLLGPINYVFFPVHICCAFFILVFIKTIVEPDLDNYPRVCTSIQSIIATEVILILDEKSAHERILKTEN